MTDEARSLPRGIRLVEKAENAVIIATFVAMVAALFLQVLNRNLTHYSMPWLEEVAVYSMIYMVMLGTEAGLRDGSQISINGLVDRLPGRGRTIVRILAKVVVVAFAAAMTIASWNVVQRQIESGQLSAALRLPMWIPYSAFLIAFCAMTLVQAYVLVTMALRLAKGEPEPETVQDELHNAVPELDELTEGSAPEAQNVGQESDPNTSDESGDAR